MGTCTLCNISIVVETPEALDRAAASGSAWGAEETRYRYNDSLQSLSAELDALKKRVDAEIERQRRV